MNTSTSLRGAQERDGAVSDHGTDVEVEQAPVRLAERGW